MVLTQDNHVGICGARLGVGLHWSGHVFGVNEKRMQDIRMVLLLGLHGRLYQEVESPINPSTRYVQYPYM
jgi:hypothetical protein